MAEPSDRFAINWNRNQIAFIPSIGILYHHSYFKFCIAFIWLNFQCRLGLFRK